MEKRETYFERIVFITITILKMLIPPVYSLEKLEKYCRSRIKKNPKAYSPRSFLAQLYKDYKKNEEAKREYEEIKLLGHMTDEDWLNLGEVLFRLEDYQGVIETLAPIIDKYPRHKNANYCLGISYMKKEDFQNAVVYIEKLLVAGNRRYEDYWHLGFCYSHIGKLEEANEAYYKAFVMKPDSKELRHNIAANHVSIGRSFLDTDVVRAEREFKRALEINPGDSEAARMLVNIPTNPG
jgi:protein O-GlcNAc transferase